VVAAVRVADVMRKAGAPWRIVRRDREQLEHTERRVLFRASAAAAKREVPAPAARKAEPEPGGVVAASTGAVDGVGDPY
jgi:hypothetical protein